ncbi:catalase [Salsuginibacillus halophilus]|uniref:Catalase n=1 Tax=Salsuginibacillus halophilus TaxID=517424 RepID=A0A2P8HL41_9BACI|nr:catalase [Salsuginibacillus halophilus]PSL46938.1 catalase [Salsuginibacillus halophilus]
MRRLTSNQGVPVGDNQNSRSAGSDGPLLLEDYHLLEKLAHFDRERIPERVVHARGAGAHGVFKVKNSMKRYTSAAFLGEEGKETPVFTRFSTVIHGAHSPETLRDPRGFSVKFYTEEGNYDFVGNNLPVFFIRDTIKFPDVIHSLKPDPRTNVQDPNRYWDFMANSPESTNMLLHLFTDEGIPASYRHMRGSSVHAFRWVNEHGNSVYVKKRWVPKEGMKNLSVEDAAEIQGKDFNHATVDLYQAIEEGNYPEWDLYVQILDPADMDNFDFHPLDATKDWLEEDIPYTFVGTMTLNKNPDDVFAETEQVSFNPGVTVPGIHPSEDKLLQGRIFSYSDTQRYRVGTNYLQLPINCPFAKVETNQRNGYMTYNQDTNPVNYEPNGYSPEDEPKEDPNYKEVFYPVSGQAGQQAIEKKDEFGQAGRIWRTYDQETKDQVIKNIGSDLQGIDQYTAMLAICNFYRADENLGQQLAEKAGIDISPYVGQM